MTSPRLTRARSQLIMNHPFFGTLAMHLTVRETRACQTMATDGSSLWYNPDFLAKPENTDRELERIVAHEVLHCALGHHTRREARDPDRWNIACDHVVNLMLREAGFTVPPDRYCDPQYRGMNAEQVYRALTPKAQPPQPEPEEPPQPQADDSASDQSPASGGQTPDGDDDTDEPSDDEDDTGGSGADSDDADDNQGDGDAGDGTADAEGEADDGSGDSQGAGDGEGDPVCHGDPGGCGEVIDAAPAHEKAALDEAAEEWAVFTRQAVNIARREGAGKLPGYLEGVAAHLADPKTDWRDVLRRFVDPMSATKDYSWSQPNRRLMSLGHYVPGLVSDGVNHIAIVVDSSGSIDDGLLAKFGAEVQAALDDGAVDKVTVVFCDTRVTRTAEYGVGDIIDFTVPGRGGTDFAPALAWIADNAPDVAAAIYFTDLDGPFGPEPSFEVLWMAYGPPAQLQRLMPRVPFGETFEIAE